MLEWSVVPRSQSQAQGAYSSSPNPSPPPFFAPLLSSLSGRTSRLHQSRPCHAILDTPYLILISSLFPFPQILIGDRAHLIEFPSLLLPPGTQSGSIVSISVARNIPAEQTHTASFRSLQSSILATYGTHSPLPPTLVLRNTTQTSVTLEWGKLELANAKLRGLEIYRNGTRLANIPNPGFNLSTKLSSLQLDTDYTFQLVL
jgi:hypothetical protein